MLNWLKRKVQLKAVQAAEEDIDRFLKGLRGADLEEIAMIAAVTAHWRNVFAAQGIDLLNPIEAERKKPGLLMLLNRTIREVQKVHPAMATGLMVWLHTARAATFPEIRAQGREMWFQLQASFVYLESAAKTFESVAGLDLILDDPYEVPADLRPRG